MKIAPDQTTSVLRAACNSRAGIRIQPGEECADAAGGQCHARIAGSVVKVDRISIRADSLSAGKYDILDVSLSLVRSFWTEHPRVSPFQADIWLFEVE